jgi:hypothetical protein
LRDRLKAKGRVHLPLVLARGLIEWADRVLGWRHAVAGRGCVASGDLVAGSDGAAGVAAAALVSRRRVRGVRVAGVLGLDPRHPVARVRTHRPVACATKQSGS